jgi:hypothetical protein
MTAGMDAMGPETAGHLMATPLCEAYMQVAPRVEDWPVLVGQVIEVVKVDYDWSAEIPGLRVPTMPVIATPTACRPPTRSSSSACSAAASATPAGTAPA